MTDITCIKTCTDKFINNARFKEECRSKTDLSSNSSSLSQNLSGVSPCLEVFSFGRNHKIKYSGFILWWWPLPIWKWGVKEICTNCCVNILVDSKINKWNLNIYICGRLEKICSTKYMIYLFIYLSNHIYYLYIYALKKNTDYKDLSHHHINFIILTFTFTF